MRIDCRLNTQKITYILFLFILILPFAMNLLGMHSLLSSTQSIVCVSILLTLCWILNFSKSTHINDMYILLLNLIFLTLNLFINMSFGVVLNFYNIIITFLVLKNLQFSRQQIKRIRGVLVVCLIILLSSFSITQAYGSLLVYSGNTYINANTYGILWLALFFNLILLIDLHVSNRLWKIWLLALTILISMSFIWASGCRTALFALVFFCVMCMMKKLDCKKVFVVLIVAGFILPSIYIALSEAYGDVQLMGKNLFSGRQNVWAKTWEQIKLSPILGTGTTLMIDIGNGNYTDSAHNVYLGIWKTIGIVPLVTFVVYLFKFSNTQHHNTIGKKAFLSCLLVCIFETVLNDSNYNILYISLLMTVQEQKNNKENL